MKKLLLPFVILFVAAFMIKTTMAQQQEFVFQQWAASSGVQNFFYKNITKTSGANTFTAGATLNSNGDYDLLVVKYTSHGTVSWARQYNGAGNGADMATGLYVDGSGNVYVTGTTYVNSTNANDIVTIKYNSSGTQQWLSTYNGSGSSYDAGGAILVNTAGTSVFICGGTMTTSNLSDFITISYNISTGAQNWATTYNYNGNYDAATKLQLTGSGLAQQLQVSGGVQYNSTTWKYATVNYNLTTGAQIGSATVSGSNTGSLAELGDVYEDPTQTYTYVAGSVNNSGTGTGYDFKLAKLQNSDLTVVWERTWNGADSLDDKAADIIVDASGNVYVTGYTTKTGEGKNYATVKYNSSGTLQWTKYHNGAGNGSDEATAINVDSDNNVYVTGTSHTGGSQDYFTIKYKPDNTVIWENSYNGLFNGTDKAYDIAIDNITKEVLVSGQTQTAAGYSYTLASLGQVTTVFPATDEALSSSFAYTENLGQLLDTDGDPTESISHYSFSSSPSLYFHSQIISYVLSSIDTVAGTDDTLHRVDLDFLTGKREQNFYGLSKRSDYYNFYLAHIPEGRAHVTNYSRLVSPEMYDSIDVVCASNSAGYTLRFVCKPGSDPDDISFTFNGADSVRIVSNDLIIYTKLGQIKHPRPTAKLINNSGAETSLGWLPSYVRTGNTITFSYGSYDTAKNLVFQMSFGSVTADVQSDNLEWCTYYGGQNDDVFYDISVIQQDYGTAHVAGLTMSTNFPLIFGQSVVQNNLAGGVDFVIVKFNADASRSFATYLGGSDEEYSPSIETDLNGNIYLAGMTKSADFPGAPLLPSGAYLDDTFAGTLDLIVAKINSAGTELTWRTFYGGDSGETYGANTAIALDNAGNIYVATNSDANQQLVTLSGAYNENVGGSVILKFNSALQRVWVTLFGDAATTKIGNNIAVDTQGNLIITGQTEGGLFTVDLGSGAYFDGSYNSTTTAGDVFIAKFNSSNALIWSTYYGGINSDNCNAITTDDFDNIYLGCNTGSYNMPTYPPPGSGYYDDDYNSSSDIFLMKFDADCKREWATFYGDGNNNSDQVTGVTITPKGQLFYCGNTNSSSNFEIMSYSNYYFQNTMASNIETFYIKFNERLEHQWTTYFGGDQIQQLADVDHYLDEKLYGVGYTTSSQLQTPKFPIRQYEGGYWQPIMGDIVGNSFDGFIARFDIYELSTGEQEIDVNPQDELSLFPNPANTLINLFFDAETQSEGILKISDVTGKLIYMTPITTLKGENKLQMDINSLSEGLYFIELMWDDKSIVRKFIKK